MAQGSGGLRALVRSTFNARRPSGDPRNRDQITGYLPPAPSSDADQAEAITTEALFGHAQRAAVENPDQISGREQASFGERWRAATTDALKQVQLKALHAALRALIDTHKLTFQVEKEAEEYLKAARARLDAGFELVVFGHTHLAKDVDLARESAPGVKRRYLNTGTWVDLMRVPDVVFDSGPDARKLLHDFATALANNQLDPWRKRAPTYADIRLDGERLEDAGVFFFDGPQEQPRLSTKGLRERVGTQ